MKKTPAPKFFKIFKKTLTIKKSRSEVFLKTLKKDQQKIKLNNIYIRYFGERKIDVEQLYKEKQWKILKKAVLEPRKGYFDSKSLHALASVVTIDGILVFYCVKPPFSLGAALFYREDPTKLLWRSENPIWTTRAKIDINDFTIDENFLELRLISKKGEINSVKLKITEILSLAYYDIVKRYSQVLRRSDNNPIISPRRDRLWESQATFNAAAIYEKGKIHLLYRAIGDNNMSVLGYASSHDGTHINERGDFPAFVPFNELDKTMNASSYSPYMSGGGGFGGCEDPRITKLGDRLYLTYVAYNGWDHPRIALTSISTEDFAKKQWSRWEKPVLMSPPGVVDKNGCILPEKIDGKFVVFHRIFPNILIDFLDDLEFSDGRYLRGEFSITPRDTSWDSRKIGAGPPPIKTKDGWLLIYHGVDDRDPGKYKIGAMLLDLKDPTKVLYRPDKPILEPIASYENEGYKAGVVYPCGAVVKDEELFVYYGGADSVLCVAHSSVNGLLDRIKHV